MNLATKLDNYFPISIQARGQQDFCQRRVTIRYGSDSEVEARVKGTYAHEVNLYWTEGLSFGAIATVLWKRAFLVGICGPRFWPPRRKDTSVKSSLQRK